MEIRLQQVGPLHNSLIRIPYREEAIEVDNVQIPASAPKHFIEANTQQVTMAHLRDDCVIPVWSKDNEVTISHTRFIEAVQESIFQMFRAEAISAPNIRVSHIIKGRTPEAIHKPVKELLDGDKTIYYERMAFCIEVPSITEDISGNRLNLTIGGVRAYNHENLYSRKGVEKFKVFIGFKNMVCCNMCVSTDGLIEEVRVTGISDLQAKVMELIALYNVHNHLKLMRSFMEYRLSEARFAQFIGKSRLYQCLPAEQKKLLPSFLMTDSQINLVARSYYNDKDFGVLNPGADLSMWNLYNLLTSANKSSYIDNFLSRAENATQISEGIISALQGDMGYRWFIE